MTKTGKALFLVVLGLLIALEIFCAKLAFETLGEITSGLYGLLIILNIIPIIFLYNRKIELAVSLIILIALIIIPYQLCLGKKLINLKEEAANIVAYVYEQKINSGNFPNDLSQYNFSFPKLQKHFTYSKETNGQFKIFYFVGTKNTSHFYYSEHKKWAYYPD